MATGAGKYDDEATMVRLVTEATTVVVIVEGGLLGDGFEVQTVDPSFAARLPKVLRAVADEIERDML